MKLPSRTPASDNRLFFPYMDPPHQNSPGRSPARSRGLSSGRSSGRTPAHSLGRSLGRGRGPRIEPLIPGCSLGLFAFFIGFEDSCHVCDLVLHFSSSLIFAYNSEPGENLVQFKTEIFAPRDWQESFFTYFVQLTNPLNQLARLMNICGNKLPCGEYYAFE